MQNPDYEKLLSSLLWLSNTKAEEPCAEDNIIEQFVKTIDAFSSQYGIETSISYTAFNIQGPPSNFPEYGDYPQAFVMRTYGDWWDQAPSSKEDFMPQNNRPVIGHDFIEISFERAVFPMNVSIFETYNPGAVVRIWAWSGKQWCLLWEGEPEVVGHTPRIFSPKLRSANFATRTLRVEFNHSLLQYYTELDAVLLEGRREKISESPVKNHFSYNPSNAMNEQKLEKGVIMNKILDSNLHKNITMPLIQNDENINEITGLPLGPFHLLPDETVLLILKYLDLRSLINCACVNKHFNRLASDAILYKSLNLKPYWHCINTQFIEALAKRCKLTQKLDLSWCGSHNMITPVGFMNFMRQCGPELKHVRLDCCDFVTNKSLSMMAHTITHIRELSLRGCNNIKQFLPLAALHHLNRLDLYRTNIKSEDLIPILYSNKKLQHLNLGSCSDIADMDEVARAIGENCTDLLSIDFWKSYSLTPEGVKALGSCVKLQEIDLGWCLHVSASGEWLYWLSNCSDMRKLFLEALRGVSNRDLRAFIHCVPRLQQLDLLGIRSVTADICTEILTECRELVLLDVSFCDLISESHVIQWRQTFPRVSIKRSFQRSYLQDTLQEDN